MTRRRSASTIAAALTVALLAAAALSQSASGATQYVFVKSFPDFNSTPTNIQSLKAQGVAFSTHNGHIYVADSGRNAIFDFESSNDTTPTKWTGATTPAGSFGSAGLSVAVDNASGDVYVGDRSHAVVDKFDEAGNLIATFGDTSPTPNGKLSGAATPAGSFSPPTSYYGSFGIAVDQATDDLYVVDAGHEVIDVFDEEGTYLRQITAKPAGIYSNGGMNMAGIAVSAPTGNVFVSDAGSHLVFEFNSLGNYVSTWNGKDQPNGQASETPSVDAHPSPGFSEWLALATVDSKHRVLVGTRSYPATVDTFDEAGNFIPPQLKDGSILFNALAIDQATEYLYAGAYDTVRVYEPRHVPDVAIGPAGEVKPQSATLTGQVAPDSGDVIGCHFEYISEGDLRLNRLNNADLWQGATQLPCQTSPPSSLPYSSATDVSAYATGLLPGRLYRQRLVASSASGTNVDIGETFRTPGEYEYSTALGTTGSGAGQLDEPRDVAVDDTTGAVYVADTGNHRVVKFDATGAFVSAWGWGVANGASENQVCTSGCQAGIPGEAPGQLTTPLFVEVDNSSGPSAHSVYVADGEDRTVLKFTPAGTPVTAWGEGGSISFAKYGPLLGMTVSSTGSLFVLSGNSPYPWTEIGQDGVFRSQTSPTFDSPGSGGIDVDSAETWYETRQPGGGGGGVLVTHGGSPGFLLYPTSYDELPTSGIVVDRDRSEPFVAQLNHIDHFRPTPACVSEHLGICEPDDSFGYGHLVEARGLAFEPSGGRVFAADSGADRVVVFSLVPKPTVTTGAATSSGSSATLSGSAEPAPGDSVTSCRFQYGTTTEYELGEVPCSPSSGSDVTATINGLVSYQTYHYRVVAEGPSELPVYGEDRTLTPAGGPPSAEGGEATEVGRTGATLNGLVNPNMGPTVYRFEYGTTPEYGSQTPVTGPVGEDNILHTVSAGVSGLTPGSTYHFRVVAINFADTAYGPDRTFNTPDAPSILQFAVSATSATTATASVSANPWFSPTTLRLDYGATPAYGSSLSEQLGPDNRSHEVDMSLTGLAPGTTYHARVVATNGFGSSSSEDLTFKTPGATPPQGPKKCRHGFVRRGGKCKKHRRHHHHRHHHHRHHHRHTGSGR